LLDKIILGFLKLKSLSSYDLKKALENSVGHFYSTSYGSIQPALKKMESLGWVRKESQPTGARKKNIFHITEKGIEEFGQWMKTEIPVTRIKEDALVKMFFFGLIPQEERIRLIEEYTKKIEETQRILEQIKALSLQQQIPEDKKEIAAYQWETLRFGIDSGEFTKQWFEDFLTKERSK